MLAYGFYYMNTQSAIKEYLEWKQAIYPCAHKSYKPFLKQFAIYFKSGISKKTMDQRLSKFISIIKDKYSPKSVYYMISILKDFFKYYPNIINPHHIKCPRLELPEIHYLSEWEFIMIDESLSIGNEYEVRAKLIHNLLWSTGIRVGELCHIHLDDINMTERFTKIITAKSKKTAHIMWSEEAHKLLINYLGWRLQRGGDYLFDISTRQVERIIKTISTNIGIEGITPHKYRHGKAHNMLKNGATVDEIAFVLRHTNPEMTKTMYLRLDQKENISMMQKFV